MAKKKKKIEDYPEVSEIIDRLKGGKPSELIAVFVPSHDRRNKELPEELQDEWEKKTLALFGRLFGGATSFGNLSGVYQPTTDDLPLYDHPKMVQTLTATERAGDEDNLVEFADFCREMGTSMNQASIGVIVNNKFVDMVMKYDE